MYPLPNDTTHLNTTATKDPRVQVGVRLQDQMNLMEIRMVGVPWLSCTPSVPRVNVIFLAKGGIEAHGTEITTQVTD